MTELLLKSNMYQVAVGCKKKNKIRGTYTSLLKEEIQLSFQLASKVLSYVGHAGSDERNPPQCWQIQAGSGFPCVFRQAVFSQHAIMSDRWLYHKQTQVILTYTDKNVFSVSGTGFFKLFYCFFFIFWGCFYCLQPFILLKCDIIVNWLDCENEHFYCLNVLLNNFNIKLFRAQYFIRQNKSCYWGKKGHFDLFLNMVFKYR